MAGSGGGMSGSPMTMVILTGWTIFEPFGMAASVPPRPTGTMGAPVRQARKAAPSKKCCVSGPYWRVPSGKSTRGSPRSSTSWQARRASRSAVPRLTGKPPRAVRNQAPKLPFHNDSLPM